MEVVEDVVIVGAGIAGLATALGLHRLGIGSLVLESSDDLRVTGFAFTTWTNAWKALDALGVAHRLRQRHDLLHGLIATSIVSAAQSNAEISFNGRGKNGEYEIRCLQRKMLLETLESELPNGTIRYSSKLVAIEESGHFKILHLVDGTIIKTKVLIGCDGVNSMVAKWLGFKPPADTGRLAVRGCVKFNSGHGLDSKFLQFFGDGIRYGFIPCDDKTIYWFFTWTPSSTQDEEIEHDPGKMKQFVLDKLGNVPNHIRQIVEATELDGMISSRLRFRYPWEVLWGNISKGNVCIAGDALHPMTPDIGQGGCIALEDGVVLVRCLGEALKEKGREDDEDERIEKGLKKYGNERRWRSIEIISTSYMVGRIQQSDGKIINLLRDKFLVKFLGGLLMKKADFDCGNLNTCKL